MLFFFFSRRGEEIGKQSIKKKLFVFLIWVLMEMASSEVDISSCQTFNCVLNRPHERCTRGDNNNNNVRNIHVVYEKNHNVLVRDHLDDEYSFNKSSVSDSVPSSSPGLDPNHVLGQPENPSRKETKGASSLVQIWEARTTQQPPSSTQNQSLIDSRTSSIGSNALENSDSLNEESIKESELIQPIEEETNEEEDEEEMECDSPFVHPSQDCVEKEREGVKVMDIVRKLSSDSGPMPSSSNENTKEVQTTEARCFPQLACSPRIRGRQAWADLVVQMARDREKELSVLLERHSVSKFTHRGRIQSTLRIRCYERCRAIQDRHRCISSSGASDLSRSPLGSGGMHFLRGRTLEKDLHRGTERKVMQEKTEKKVMQERTEKSGLKETQEVVSAVVKKSVLSETAENKNSSKKSVGESIQKETKEGRGEKRETKEKADAKESSNGRGEKQETKEKVEAKESQNGKGEKRETKEKAEAKESLNGRGERRETKEKAEAKERPNGRGEKGETKEKAEAKESSNGRGEKRESTKEKPIAKESVEGKPLVGIAEKVNLWNSEEKMNNRKGFEKGKADTERVEKTVLEEATKRILNVENAERCSTTTTTTTSREIMMPLCVFSEKVVRRKEKEDSVSESKSKEIEDRNAGPQEVIRQEDSWLPKLASEDKVLKEATMKCNLKKPIVKEVREERGERLEASVTVNNLMGIAEKVNLWNATEKKNRIKVMEKGKGKTENKANTETNDVLQEASRRISNLETAERSIDTSRAKVDNKGVMDRRESSIETKSFETEEKGRRKKDDDFASVEAKPKENSEDKNMNSKPLSHGSRVKDNEKSSLQHSEAMSILTEAKYAKEIDGNNPQEVTQEKECVSEGSKDRSKEKNSSLPDVQNGFKEPKDEEIKKVEREEEGEEEAKEVAEAFVNYWDENAMVEEGEYEDYDLYMGEYMDDWIHDISRPRSYWEDLRKERYLEVLNTESGKKDICNLIESRTVSNFLASDLRKKIDNLMISRVQSHLGIPINQVVAEEDGEEDSLMISRVQSHIRIPIHQLVAEEDREEEEEWEAECSARNQEDNETEEEPDKTILEAESDNCSQSPASSTMMTWTFRDQEPTTSSSLPEPSVPTNQSTQEMQIISDLQSQVEQLQRQVLELQLSVKSCIDMQLQFQNSITQDPPQPSSSSEQQRVDTNKDPLKRKCCVCSEMPVDSLLYRCGHMCTCLKCAHELQWSSKKCPICMAPIVDVVRAFLDS